MIRFDHLSLIYFPEFLTLNQGTLGGGAKKSVKLSTPIVSQTDILKDKITLEKVQRWDAKNGSSSKKSTPEIASRPINNEISDRR